MPILSSAKKALRQTKWRTLVNRPIKSRAKTMMDRMRATPSAQHLSDAFSAIDRAVKRHIFHRNKAARLKSQLSKVLAAAASATAKK